jgi:uroporphyrinogen decarboxylase
MNGRERILAVLKGDLPDRVPVSLFVQEEFLSLLHPDRKTDRVQDAVECAKYFDFDIMTRSKKFEKPYFMKKSYLNWELQFSTLRDSGKYYEIFEIKTPLKVLKQVEVGPDIGNRVDGIHLSTMEYLIKDESDLDAFIRYVPSIDQDTAEDVREYCRWSRSVIGDLGISVPWGMGGTYNLAATYREVTELMMDPYDNPEFYTAYMDKLTDLIIEFDMLLAAENKDAIGIQGNIANSGVIGKDYFKKYIYDYEKKHADAIQQAGSFTVYHNCGKAEVLQECYADMGLSAWETIAEPPRGDSSLAKAKEKIGRRITLIGNLDQVDFLKTASEKEVEKRVEQILLIGKPGGKYIFACSDFLEVGTPFENVAAAVKTAKAFGTY